MSGTLRYVTTSEARGVEQAYLGPAQISPSALLLISIR